MIPVVIILGGIALLLFFTQQPADAETAAPADFSGTDETAGPTQIFHAPPADSFSNPEIGDVILGGSGVQVTPAKVDLLARAIATAEGFFNPDPNVIPRRAHNPGDLTRSFGQPTTGVANSEGVLQFASDDAGWSALKAEATAMLTGGSHVYSPTMSIYTIAEKWTDRDPNAENWASTVAEHLGIDPSQTLADFLGT